MWTLQVDWRGSVSTERWSWEEAAESRRERGNDLRRIHRQVVQEGAPGSAGRGRAGKGSGAFWKGDQDVGSERRTAGRFHRAR